MPSGAADEQRAAEYLVGQGLRLVERNWRCPFGEIDLICREGDVLVFVEVRARRTASARGFGGAAASITAAKRERLIKTAGLYLSRLPRQPDCRFDAVLVDGPQLNWLRNAFEAG